MAGRGASILERIARGALVTLWLAFSLLSAARAEQPDEQVFNINLPAQPVPEALNALAEQTGVSVLFPYDLARNRMANEVSGRFSLLKALELLLRGTGLSGGLSDNGVLTISATKPEAANTKEKTLTDTAQASTGATKKGVFATIAAFLAS